MGRHAASKIGPFRFSGVNPRPETRQQAPVVPQRPVDEYPDERIDLGKLGRDRYIAERAAGAKDARLVAVAPVPESAPGVVVYLGDIPHRIPASWRVRVNRASNGMQMMFALDTSSRLRIFTNASAGNLVELVDIPRDVVAEIHAGAFPGGAS